MINNSYNLTDFIIDDYKKFEEEPLEIEQFELVHGDILESIEYPETIKDIGNKILQAGAALDYLTYIPGFDAYIDSDKLNTVARVCKLPSQINDITETVIDKSNMQDSMSDTIVKSAKLTSTTCKVLATTAFLAQPLLPAAAGVAIMTGIGYTTGVGKLIDYGLITHEVYNNLTNFKNKE